MLTANGRLRAADEGGCFRTYSAYFSQTLHGHNEHWGVKVSLAFRFSFA